MPTGVETNRDYILMNQVVSLLPGTQILFDYLHLVRAVLRF